MAIYTDQSDFQKDVDDNWIVLNHEKQTRINQVSKTEYFVRQKSAINEYDIEALIDLSDCSFCIEEMIDEDFLDEDYLNKPYPNEHIIYAWFEYHHLGQDEDEVDAIDEYE